MANPKIPKNETIWVTICGGEATYYITAKPMRDTYFIYKFVNDVTTKLGQNKNPKALEEKYIK